MRKIKITVANEDGEVLDVRTIEIENKVNAIAFRPLDTLSQVFRIDERSLIIRNKVG